MSNRVYNFVRAILQNSRLNGEKFIKNKKIYNISLKKNSQSILYNRIISRKVHTYNVPPPKNGGNWLFIIVASSGVYILDYFNKKNL